VRYLVDTCVLSELLRKNPEPKVVRWMDERDTMTHLSVLTLGELQKGVAKLPDGKRKEQIQAWIDRNLLERFEGRVIPVDAEIASTWGRITGEAESQGRKLPVIDSLIAATAVTYNLIVVTRNSHDLLGCGARVFNPWE
jgi:predicted nucleic acid-binding protein